MAVTKTINLSSGVQYAPYGVLTVTETATSTADNTSTVSISLVLKRPYNVSSTATKSATCTINGTTYSWSGTIGGTGDLTLISKNQTITHGSDGTKSISISASIVLQITWSGQYIDTISNSGSMTLTPIERYPSSNQSLSSRTETSFTVAWNSDTTIDRVWYSTNGGSTWSSAITVNATSGTYTITGLTAGTQYSVVTSLRSKASGLYTNSSAATWRTYYYPYCNSAPDFTIGNALKIGLYNPLGRAVTITMTGANGSTKTAGGTYSGKSVTGFNSSQWVDFWYASIPSALKGQYSVTVTYNDGSDHTATGVGGYYSVVAADCGPTANDLTYADTNMSTISITGNNQKIVQNMSTVTFTVNNVIAKNHATISSVSVRINGVGYVLQRSGNTNTYTATDITLNYASNVQAQLVVEDSRGLAMSPTPTTITMLPYSTPSAIISLQRQYNYYSNSYITVNATYSTVNGGNSIVIKYKIKKTSSSSWETETTINNRTQYSFTADNQYDWNVRVTITDSIGAVVTYNAVLPKGMPIEFWDALRSSVGINCFPQTDDSLWVNGHEFIPENYGYHDFDLGSGAQTVSSARYVQLLSASDMNAYLPSGCVWVKAEAIRWNTATGVFNLNIYGDGTLYLIMENGKSISNLKVRCFFAKCVSV